MPVEKRGEFGYWRDPLCLMSAGMYVINREWIKPNLHHYSPFFHGHLNDCLFVPTVLPLFLLFYRWIGLRPDDAPPRFWEMAWHVLVWSIFFEWFGPVALHQGTSDWIDAVCYMVTGVVAWLIWNHDGFVMMRGLKEQAR